MNKTIGILGCGWLGFPLAKDLLADGHKVKGSTTSVEKLPQLENAGIQAFLVQLQPEKVSDSLPNFLKGLDSLVINVPPKLRRGSAENYVAKMQQLYGEIRRSETAKVVFVSSTSVYGNEPIEFTEESEPRPETESGKQLLEAEALFRNDATLKTTILRLGGLIGSDRHPVTMLSGKKDLKNGNAPVNLIHRKDAIHMIKTILEKEYWNELFNGVYPEHPAKREYYQNEAIKRGLPMPEYRDEKAKIHGKTVKSRTFLNKKQSFLTPITS